MTENQTLSDDTRGHRRLMHIIDNAHLFKSTSIRTMAEELKLPLTRILVDADINLIGLDLEEIGLALNGGRWTTHSCIVGVDFWHEEFSIISICGGSEEELAQILAVLKQHEVTEDDLDDLDRLRAFTMPGPILEFFPKLQVAGVINGGVVSSSKLRSMLEHTVGTLTAANATTSVAMLTANIVLVYSPVNIDYTGEGDLVWSIHYNHYAHDQAAANEYATMKRIANSNSITGHPNFWPALLTLAVLANAAAAFLSK